MGLMLKSVRITFVSWSDNRTEQAEWQTQLLVVAGISGSGPASPPARPAALALAAVVVADTDEISKANGSQKLISERDFCLGRHSDYYCYCVALR